MYVPDGGHACPGARCRGDGRGGLGLSERHREARGRFVVLGHFGAAAGPADVRETGDGRCFFAATVVGWSCGEGQVVVAAGLGLAAGGASPGSYKVEVTFWLSFPDLI